MTHASPIVLRGFHQGIDRDQSNSTRRQQRRLLEELMHFASNLVSVLEIRGILITTLGPGRKPLSISTFGLAWIRTMTK
jgi:hypothetical protein